MADRGRKRWTASEGGTRSRAKKQGLREKERKAENEKNISPRKNTLGTRGD